MKNNIVQTILEEELENVVFPDLTSREKEVLKLQEQSLSLSVIGKRKGFGISKERVRQIGEKARSKVKQRKEIIQKINERLNQYVFTESEVWEAFLKFYQKKKLRHATIKMKWQDFCKVLWKGKQK